MSCGEPNPNVLPLVESVQNLSVVASNLSVAAYNTAGCLSQTYAGTTYVPNDSTSIPNGWTPTTTPLTGVDFDWSKSIVPTPCADYHVLTEELLQVEADEVVGTCIRCGVRVFVPRIAGAFSFERAGSFVGRAMSLDSEDPEEKLGDLMAELAALEKQIKRDQARLERAREMLVIARNTAKKHATKELVS